MAIGEVSLSGDLRRVPPPRQARLREARAPRLRTACRVPAQQAEETAQVSRHPSVVGAARRCATRYETLLGDT